MTKKGSITKYIFLHLLKKLFLRSYLLMFILLLSGILCVMQVFAHMTGGHIGVLK